MTTQPLVTIGIPVYNVEPYIEKCLLSVLNQSYENLEILVVDDLGTDDSMEIVSRLQQTHPKGSWIRVIRQSQNGGSGVARNAVMDQADGKYIYFLDSDDYIEECTISAMVEQAEAHDTDAVIASLRKVVYGTTDELPTLQYHTYQLISGKDEFAHLVCQDLRWHIAITACNILFKKDFLNRHQIRFLASKDEDALFLSDYYSEIERAVIMPDVFYNYVIRPGSKMGSNARDVIPVNEIRDRFFTDAIMTERCARLKGRSYYDVHCARVMKHKFRAVCVALRHRHRFSELLSDSEIRQELKHPASWKEILSFHRYRGLHIFFYVLGSMPPKMTVACSYVFGKLMRWI